LSTRQQHDAAHIAQRLDILSFQANLSAIAVSFVSAAFLFILLWPYVGERSFVLLWFFAVSILMALRLAGHFYCARSFSDPKTLDLSKSSFWERHNIVALGFSGLLWSILAIGVVDHLPDALFFCVLLVIFSLSTGATGTLAPLKNAARLYFVTMLVPISALLITRADEMQFLGYLGFAFLALNLAFHRGNHKTIIHLEDLQNANRRLAEDLAQERGELAHLNDHLEDQVRERTQELRFLAHHDPLTGLYNRTGLLHWVQDRQSKEDSELELAVIFVDLDRFKQINDALGHGVGDFALKEISRRLMTGKPDEAAICRWGGDEFVILLPQVHDRVLEAGRELADMLRESTEQAIAVEGRQLHIGFSAGVSVADQTVASVREAIQLADLAMGEAKRVHRGVTRLYSDELSEKHERQLSIAQALRNLDHDSELTIAVQPIVDTKTFKTECLEVLLRWKSPGLGQVGPDEFIPIAEDTGTILSMGLYVLNRALAELAASDYGKSGGRIAINVSVRQLVDKTFAAAVPEALARHGIDPRQLSLEVTETVLDSHDLSDIAASLQRLHHNGIEIQVDDFGTGYSSLSRLHRLPISALKIDRSFVLAMDKNSLAVIEGSVLIARKSGLKVVAEGIETRESAVALQEMGVDFLQGYYFGKPVSGIDQAIANADQFSITNDEDTSG
jgi:diguanylate cyclase (GGDEF)-like protein